MSDHQDTERSLDKESLFLPRIKGFVIARVQFPRRVNVFSLSEDKRGERHTPTFLENARRDNKDTVDRGNLERSFSGMAKDDCVVLTVERFIVDFRNQIRVSILHLECVLITGYLNIFISIHMCDISYHPFSSTSINCRIDGTTRENK
jgi:hypothetical protein